MHDLTEGEEHQEQVGKKDMQDEHKGMAAFENAVG
jgi:hypothetical protein